MSERQDGGAAKAPMKRHDALCSFAERVEQLQERTRMDERTRANLVRALDSVDPAKRAEFLEKHGPMLADIETLASVKYADLGYWGHRNVQLAQWLDLDNSPPLDILDIGAGSGNFGMVVQSMGHSYLATDVADPWYDELCRLTNVERMVAPVMRGERYAPVDRKFDMITIMLPAFHRKTVKGKRVYWELEDWRQFLLGITEDLLKPNGSIFILMPLDKADDGSLSYSPFVQWAYDRGARLDRTAPRGPLRHIQFDPATPETFSEEGPDIGERPEVDLVWQN